MIFLSYISVASRVIMKIFLCIIWLGIMLFSFFLFKAIRLKTVDDMPRYFHRGFLKILNININLIGKIKETKPGLLISNHASWLDISIISSLANINFIAKSEVASWPLFGFLAKLQNTFFVERKATKAGRQSDKLKEFINKGKRLVLFPEGTSSDGNRVLNFKSSLFSIADNTEDSGNYLLQAITICYKKIDGLPISRSERPFIAWWGGMGLMGHLFKIFTLRRVDIIVIAHEPIGNVGNRKIVSTIAWKQVAYGLSLALLGSPRSLKYNEDIYKLL